jgi:predicted nucleic acid-binding protein
VSLSIAYGASFADAQTALAAIVRMRTHRFVADATRADALPTLSSSKEVTDAHLVRLAARHRLKLATLDGNLARKSWAAGIAENPL